MFDLGDDGNHYSKKVTHYYVWSMDYGLQRKVYFSFFCGLVISSFYLTKVPTDEVDALLRMIVNISPGKNLTAEPA